MVKHSAVQASDSADLSARSESPHSGIEFALLGFLITVALGCFLYKHYRASMLRRRTKLLERVWQLETNKRTMGR
jgi:hypothetical protein